MLNLPRFLRFVALTALVGVQAPQSSWAEERKAAIVVGVPTVLSGDLSALGQNIARTVQTYQRYYLRHPISFVFEDAKKSSADGLTAYQRLISQEHVDVLIGGTTSNGTLAAKQLINQSRTVLITPLTGGANIDSAGPYIFRIGNSDIQNGKEQAELFVRRGIMHVALLTEETEYTQDIANAFRTRFRELAGTVVYDETFLPDSTDFRSLITQLMRTNPKGLYMATQSGLAFGLFLKQARHQSALQTAEIHTNFLSAENPDAMEAGGIAMKGVHYLKPAYDAESPATKEFFAQYQANHGSAPTIPFHTAGTVDALELLQRYLDSHETFSREGFRAFLEKAVTNYHGLMGTYSFDSEGNSNLGFTPAIIK